MAEHDDRDAALRGGLRTELREVVRAELGGNMRCPVCGEPLAAGGQEALRVASGIWEWRAQIYCSAAGGEHFYRLSAGAVARGNLPPLLA